MNLTSKRMLQFFAGCAGAFAFSATATTYVADNFENLGAGYGPTTNGYENMPIAVYKCQPTGTGGEITNYQWYADADDASKLVTNASPYAGSVRPMQGSDTVLALNLDTNGKTLVRTNNATVFFDDDNPYYVDTLIKFTPSEDNPTIGDSTVKAAVFLDANLHLWVYHGVDGPGANSASSDTGLVVSTNEWHRLTIQMSALPVEGEASPDYAFKVYIDQQVVSCADGMQDDTTPNGPWFWSASLQNSFTSVAFQGTGLVDELVVVDQEPAGITPSAVWLTMDFDAAQVMVYTNGVSIADLALVADATPIVIAAKPWFQITNGGALLVNATSNLFTSGVVTSIVGTVTGANGATNTILAASFSTTAGLPTGFGSADINDVIAWANAKSVTPDSMTTDMLDDYLLNVAPGTDAELKITKITYGATDLTIEVEATDAAVPMDNFYGVLNVWTASSLASPTTWSSVTYTPSSSTATKLIFTVPSPANKFIKVSVETTSLIPVEP